MGLTTAVLFSNSGLNVDLIEVNPKRLKTLESGKSHFYEVGVNALLQKALHEKTLTISNDAEQALKSAQVVFSCVGTPDNPDGSSNLSYVFSVAELVAKHAKDNSIFVQKSTVPVGTGLEIEKLFNKYRKTIHYVSNPEFLREGTAIEDSLWFDRVVAGGNHEPSVKTVLSLYKKMDEQRENLAKIAKIIPNRVPQSKYIETNRNSAELIKVTANAFLALKISFANSIAKLADQADADVVDVMDAVGADNRIGRAFLNAGRGYGGGCFPKDVSGLIASSTEHGVNMPIMVAAQDENESMPGYIANKAQESLGTLKDKKIAVLGLAFKAGTSDVRRSPGVKLANILDAAGAKVNVYDPHANGEAKEDLRQGVTICRIATEATKGMEAIFITTDWKEFISMDLGELAKNMKGSLFVDAVNSFNPTDIKKAGLAYIGVGR